MTLLDKASELYKMALEAKPKNDAMVLQLQQYIVTHFGHEGTRAMAAIEEGPLDYKYKSVGSVNRMRAFQHPLNVNQQSPVEEETPATPAERPDPYDELRVEYAAVGERLAVEKDPAIRRTMVSKSVALKVRMNALAPVDATPAKLPARKIAPPVKEQQPGNTTKSRELATKHKVDAVKSAQSVGKPERPSNSQIPNPVVAAGDAQTGGVKTTDAPESTNHPAPDINVIKTMRAKAVGTVYPPEVLKFWLTRMGVELTGKESATQLGQLVLQHTDKMAETSFTDQPA